MRAGSKEHIASMDIAAPEIMDVNQDEVRRTFARYGVDCIIHGHTHRPAVHEMQIDGHAAVRIVLGDWYEQGSVLRWDRAGVRAGEVVPMPDLLEHALDLQPHELVLPLAERCGSALPLLLDEGVDSQTQTTIGDTHEATGLHQTYAGRMVCCSEQALQNSRIDRLRSKVTHVAPLANHAVDGVLLRLAEQCRPRVVF